MPTPAPNLGYGERGEAPINAVNQYMRAAPWYQALLKSFGQDPNNVHLNDSQKQQVIRAAQANGIVVDEGHNGQEVDDSGNFRAKGHALRNTLIVAGIAGAALATMGAAGVFAGGAGAGAAAGSGAAAAGAGGVGVSAGTVAAGAAGLGASAVPWGSIIGAGTNLFGNLFAAHEQTSAADHAAEISAAAAKYSADLTAKANADALAFQQSSALNAFQNSEAARRGNYDIDAARQRRLGFIGEEVGLGPREIPAYAPGVAPTFGEAAAGSGVPAATGGVDPKISAFIADWQKTHPDDIRIEPLAAAVAKQFPGVTRYDYGANGGLSNNELNVGGQKYKVLGGEGTAARYWYAPGMNDSPGARTAPVMRPFAAAPPTTATPFMPATVRPGVQIPQAIGYYA